MYAMTYLNPTPDWVEMISQQIHQWAAVQLHTPVPKSQMAALSQMVLFL